MDTRKKIIGKNKAMDADRRPSTVYTVGKHEIEFKAPYCTSSYLEAIKNSHKDSDRCR